MSEVTQILQRIEKGDGKASAELLPLVYDELRRLASIRLRGERVEHTLSPTALVHEAYVRLVDKEADAARWNSRGHFFGAAAEAMRRILVEHARQKRALKRGGDREHISLESAPPTEPERRHDLLALDEALVRLEREQSHLAELVKLRYFAGLTMPQAAEAMQVSLRTAERNWTYARAWLLEAIADD